ncbi:MAG: MoaD/ThiS family protein [Pseudomonadota bacterium]
MRIVFLGRLADRFGQERRVDLSANLTVADAIEALEDDDVGLLRAPGISYVLDHHVVGLDMILGDAKELAFLPPVSGG